MRGLRRFCFGMTVLFMGWSGSATWAQSPMPPAQGGNGGLAWPPPGMNVPQPSPGQHGGMPAPIYRPEGSGVMPAQYQLPAPAGPGPMGMPPGVPPQGMAPGQLQPYPGTDMYRYGTQQTINERGLWFSEKLNSSRDYHATIELMFPIYGGAGNGLFGYGGIDTGIGATDGIPPSYFSSPRSPGEDSGGTGGTGGGGGGGTGGNTGPGVDENLRLLERYFPYQDFGNMFNKDSSVGLKLDLGFENQDGSGVSINAWWGGEATQSFQQGQEATRNYVPQLDPFDVPGNDPLYILELNALNSSLPIDNGTGVAERIPYDTMFQVQFSQQAWGTGLQILRPAISKSDWYQVRPIIGLRYIDIREAMNFRGLDSGAEYEINNYNDIDYVQEFETFFDLEYPPGLTSSTTTTLAEPGFEGRPLGDTFNDDASLESPSNVYPFTYYPTNPYESQIHASSQSWAAGPELGLRTDLGGGDNLKLTFMATAGLMATSETMKLSGFGIYNHFANRVDPDGAEETPDGGLLGTGVGGLTDEETYFEDKSNSTHVSPTLDLSVSLEFRLFEYVPVLRRIQILEEAKFRTSYGFLYVGNVARPQDSISYVTYPVNPSLNPDRSGWSMENWTLGLHWNY